MNRCSVIVSSGSYIPALRVLNSDFANSEFFDQNGNKLQKSNSEIIRQFEQITGISERRYVTDDLVASNIAFFAAKDALMSGGIDAETLDYIIVAHNFGDVRKDNPRSDFVPSLAARVKHHLNIKNPATIAYDLPFGCAGWLQGVIQADSYIKSGNATKVLVIGAETLSRVCDPHDRDSMIYSDGAGAVVLSVKNCQQDPEGVLTNSQRSYTKEQAYLLQMGKSYNPHYNDERLFLKMAGRKLYEYALRFVPEAIKDCIDKAGLDIQQIKKVLIHQANYKMDEAILRELYSQYNFSVEPETVMPMTISWLGNSSVATIPTLYDLLTKGKIKGHSLEEGSYVVFASVGAGLNINALTYKVPVMDV